jgi:arylsulfatase A-like enzyme
VQTHSGIFSLIVFSFCLTISSFAERPNVLIISIDDMNDWVGVLGGHPDAHTPNIDRLAERGTLFANAHTASPVCNPSRAALISGLGPYRTGIYHNQDTWNLSEAMGKSVYLTRHFHDQGYYTMLAGKLFHGRLPDTEDALGLDEYAGDFGGMNFKLFADDYPYPFQDLHGIHNFAVHWGGLEGEKAGQLSDPQIADWAVSRLEQVYDQPFFLVAGFYRPHTPLISPKEFYDLFDREEIALPPLNPNDLDDMPWMGRQVAIAGYQAMSGGHYKNIVERGYQRDIVKGYLAACAFVDAQIGKVLDALERSPHRDNTIVVLFSDHGWGMGERYHFKKWGLWDDTTRVPLVIHAPGISKAGHQSDHGVSLIDIYPTLVDLCGIETPPQELDGTTLRPLLENPSAHWEKPTLTTFGQNNHALRTDRWRYIRWSDGSEELYDHHSDPHEWYNLADKQQGARVKARLSGYFPKTNVRAVRSDHASPVTLTPKSSSRFFSSVQPTIAGKGIRIEATIGPELGDGVILSHGGQFCGYALYIQDGYLCMSVMDVPRPLQWDTLIPSRTIIRSKEPLPKQGKLNIEGRLNSDGSIVIKTNGKTVGKGKADTLSIHPAGMMILGNTPARHVPVGDYPVPYPFKGDILSATVHFGD